MAIRSFWGDEFGWTDVCVSNPEPLGRVEEGLCDLTGREGMISPGLNISVTGTELKAVQHLFTVAPSSPYYMTSPDTSQG